MTNFQVTKCLTKHFRDMYILCIICNNLLNIYKKKRLKLDENTIRSSVFINYNCGLQILVSDTCFSFYRGLSG